MQGKMVRMNEVNDDPQELPETLPPGPYSVRVSEKIDKTSANGDPMVNIKLEVTEGPHKGQWLYDNILLSSNPESPGWRVRWRAKQFLASIDEPHDGDTFEWDSADWLFKNCQILVKNEKQTFKTRNGEEVTQMKTVVRQYAPIGYGTTVEATSAVVGKGNNKKDAAEEPDEEIPF